MITTQLNLNFEQSIRSATENYYKLLQPLGSGKNASTYLALQTSNENAGTIRVLKILNDPADNERSSRFNTEISLLNKLEHNSIMKFSDSGEYKANDLRYPFYVCDFYNETLATVISKKSSSTFEKIGYAIQLCSALAYLDNQKILHSDIKPDNIFIDGIKCILGDFGMATSKQSQYNYSLPSLHRYRSPDIVKAMSDGSSITSKSDVFLLGLTLAELFTGDNICEVSESGSKDVVVNSNFKLPGKYGYNISGVLNGMLKFDPNQRFSANQCIAYLQKILFDIGRDLIDVEGRLI